MRSARKRVLPSHVRFRDMSVLRDARSRRLYSSGFLSAACWLTLGSVYASRLTLTRTESVQTKGVHSKRNRAQGSCNAIFVLNSM